MLLRFATFCVEMMMNQVISLDDDRKTLMQMVKEDTLCVEITDLNFSFTLIPGERQFQIQPLALEAKLTLKGKLNDLIAFTLEKNPQSFFSSKKLDYEGDLAVLQHYQTLLGALNINWYRLIPYIPEPLSYMIVQQLEKLAQKSRGAAKKLSHDLRDYIVEEKRLVLGREEMDDFFDDIKNLQDDIERLERRLSLE